MKAAVRGVTSGDKGFEKYPQLIRDNFVCLNVYPSTGADETGLRGPKGPFQFQDKSLPVLVIKRWDGTTLVQQLGMIRADEAGGKRWIADFIDDSVSKNGTVIPPRFVIPLDTAFKKAEAYLEKDRTSYAIKELQKVVKAGASKKAFPKGPPAVVAQAAERLKAIAEKGEAELEEAVAAAKADPKKAAKAYRDLLRSYKGLSELEAKIKQAQKELRKD